MPELQILFKPELAAAVHSGLKSVTRRAQNARFTLAAAGPLRGSPWGAAGDTLWVRETIRPAMLHDTPVILYADNAFAVPAVDADAFRRICRGARRDHGNGLASWNMVPSMNMPRWACRTRLLLSSARSERLQDITVAEIIKEGCRFTQDGWQFSQADEPQAFAIDAWKLVWDRLAPPGHRFADNPLVARFEFTRLPGYVVARSLAPERRSA